MDALAALGIIESFYLETREGLFFAVKGLVHPPDRVIGVVRYVPDADHGSRVRSGMAYRRLYHFPEQEQLLRSQFPHYLKHDPVFQTTLQSVPRTLIGRVYDPRTRAVELCSEQQSHPVLTDAADFIKSLQTRSGVPSSAIGISGSILIDMHRDSSDLDISVFGLQNSQKVYQALQSILQSGSDPEWNRLDAAGVAELYEQRTPDTQMAFDDFVASERNKICQGSFRARPYFIRFLKDPQEIQENYGEIRYSAMGRATIEASIVDDQDAIFTPCRYGVSGVKILDGPEIPIDEIVSFRGRFCEQACIGDAVVATGTVERLENSKGRIHYRLLLGNSPLDTMIKTRPG